MCTHAMISHILEQLGESFLNGRIASTGLLRLKDCVLRTTNQDLVARSRSPLSSPGRKNSNHIRLDAARYIRKLDNFIFRVVS